MGHHTKEKGDKGNLKIICDLAEKGLKVLIPLSEHLPFDLVAFNPDSGNLYKIQSKFKTLKNGTISVNLRTSYSTSKGCFSSRYNDADFDVLAVYCPDLERVLYVKETDIRQIKSQLVFRVNEPKAGVSGVITTESRMYYDFLDFPYN